MSQPIYAIVAEFEDPDDLLEAAERVYAEGYRKVEAYSPFPVHGLAEAIGCDDSKVRWTCFLAGVTGAVVGMGMEVFCLAIDYPLNIGGRPLISWPQFIPVAYELTILCASFGAALGMLGFNGLPRPHHPIFNAKNFERASQDRFFIGVEAVDPKFDLEATDAFLRSLGAAEVSVVEE